MRKSNYACVCQRVSLTKQAAFGLLMAGILLAAIPATATAQLLQEEVHTFYFQEQDLSWDSSFHYEFDVPLFDTQGGTRQLTKYALRHTGPMLGASFTAGANPSPNYVCEQASFSTTFGVTASDPGVDLIYPAPPNGYPFEQHEGWAVYADPWSEPYSHTWGISLDPPRPGIWYMNMEFEDPEQLAAMSGTGMLGLEADLTLSDVEFTVADMPPDFPYIHQPGMLSFESLNELGARFDVVYYYLPVPEPSSLGLLCIGGLAALRRRR